MTTKQLHTTPFIKQSNATTDNIKDISTKKVQIATESTHYMATDPRGTVADGTIEMRTTDGTTTANFLRISTMSTDRPQTSPSGVTQGSNLSPIQRTTRKELQAVTEDITTADGTQSSVTLEGSQTTNSQDVTCSADYESSYASSFDMVTGM